MPADSPFPEVTNAQWVKIEGSKGRKFLTAILRPDGPGPFAVVLVLHGSDGLERDYLSVAQDVAKAGFLVLYGCWQAGEMGSTGNRICSEATSMLEWLADPPNNSGNELIAFARSLPTARSDRIGLYGMSRGGNASLWAASTGAQVQAIVADAPPDLPDAKDVVTTLAAPVLLMHGTEDPQTPVKASREYEKAARDKGKPIVALYFEGIGHVVSTQPQSQVDARGHAIAFFRDHLLK
jgi:dienelactone hydrolase